MIYTSIKPQSLIKPVRKLWLLEEKSLSLLNILINNIAYLEVYYNTGGK